MKRLLWSLIVFAGIGIILSLAAQLVTVLRLPNPPAGGFQVLVGGVFVVWFPAVLAASRLTRGASKRNLWQVALRGGPRWMQRAIQGTTAYAVLCFGLTFLLPLGGDTAGNVFWLGGGAVIMAFYATGGGLLYSFVMADTRVVRCPNGHEVSPLAAYCEACGCSVESRDSAG